MNKTSSTNFNSFMTDLETNLDLYLVKKAPVLPDNIKEFMVKYSPYLLLIVVVFSLPSILFALGLGALLTPFAFLGGVRYGFSFSITSLILLASVILDILAIPGLFSRSLSGWRKIYYATLLTALHSLLNFSLGNFIFGTIISLYFLFQVKSYYKN
jgi:hypothetical protein